MKKPWNAVFRIPKGEVRKGRRKAENGRLGPDDWVAIGGVPNHDRSGTLSAGWQGMRIANSGGGNRTEHGKSPSKPS
jgi:hypothetical protein